MVLGLDAVTNCHHHRHFEVHAVSILDKRGEEETEAKVERMM
jgi:hypothetical protein